MRHLQPSPPRTLALTACSTAPTRAQSSTRPLSVLIGLGRTELLSRSQQSSHQSSPCTPKSASPSSVFGDPLSCRLTPNSPVRALRRQTVQFDNGCSPLAHGFTTALSNVHSASELRRADQSNSALRSRTSELAASTSAVASLASNADDSTCCLEHASSTTAVHTACVSSLPGLPSALSTPKKDTCLLLCDAQPIRRVAAASRLHRSAAPPLSLCVGNSGTPSSLAASLTPVGMGVLSPRFASTLNSPHVGMPRSAFVFAPSAHTIALLHRNVERSGSANSGGARDNAAALESSLTRMRRSALGQSAPTLSFVPVRSSPHSLLSCVWLFCHWQCADLSFQPTVCSAARMLVCDCDHE